MKLSFLLSILPMILIANACDLVLSELPIERVHIFQVDSRQFRNNSLLVCLTISKFDANQTYLTRLDYLPNVGLEANNDNQMNIARGHLQTEFRIIKKSDPLLIGEHQSFSYKFALQVRKATTFPFLSTQRILYTYILNEYLLVLIIASVISWSVEKYIFGADSSEKIKPL